MFVGDCCVFVSVLFLRCKVAFCLMVAARCAFFVLRCVLITVCKWWQRVVCYALFVV